MDELPADAAAVALAGAVAGDAMADPLELAELFDVDVDHLAGVLALVAAEWLGRFQGAQLVEAQALEHAADGGRRDADLAAISLPGMRWRRRLSMRSTTSGGVGWRSRCGRE